MLRAFLSYTLVFLFFTNIPANAQANLTQKALIKMAKDQRVEVRCLVAQNAKTPQKILVLLAYDQSVDVRSQIAKNPHSPQKALKKLAKDCSIWVQGLVKNNPKTSKEIITKLKRRLITIKAYKLPFSKIIDKIRKQTGQKITYDFRLANFPVTLQLNEVPWQKLLDIIATRHNWLITRHRDGIHISMPKLIALNEDEVDVRKLIHRLSPQKITIPQVIEGNVSIKLDNEPWPKLIKAIVREFDYDFVQQPTWRIIPRKKSSITQNLWKTRLFPQVKPLPRYEYCKFASFIKKVRLKTGFNIICDKEVKDINFFFENKSVHKALAYFAEHNDCLVEDIGGGIIKVSKAYLVTLEAVDKNIVNILEKIANATDDIVVIPEIYGKVFISLENVKWQDALNAVANTKGYELIKEFDRVYRVAAIKRKGAKKIPISTPIPSSPHDTYDPRIRRVSMDVYKEPFSDVIEGLKEHGACSGIRYNDAIKKILVTIKLHQATHWEALETIAKKYNCRIEHGLCKHWVVKIPTISINAAGIDIRKLILLLAKINYQNVVFADEVQGKCFFKLFNILDDKALKKVLSMHGYNIEHDKRIWRVTTNKKASQLQNFKPRVFRIANTSFTFQGIIELTDFPGNMLLFLDCKSPYKNGEFPSNSLAFINNKIVYQGKVLQKGIVVKKIQKEKIVFGYQNRSIVFHCK